MPTSNSKSPPIKFPIKIVRYFYRPYWSDFVIFIVFLLVSLGYWPYSTSVAVEGCTNRTTNVGPISLDPRWWLHQGRPKIFCKTKSLPRACRLYQNLIFVESKLHWILNFLKTIFFGLTKLCVCRRNQRPFHVDCRLRLTSISEFFSRSIVLRSRALAQNNAVNTWWLVRSPTTFDAIANARLLLSLFILMQRTLLPRLHKTCPQEAALTIFLSWMLFAFIRWTHSPASWTFFS